MLDPKNKLYRWGPISGCPLFMYFTIEPAFAPLKDVLGICYPESVIIFHEKKVLWVLDENETLKHSKKFAARNVLNNGPQHYFRLWKDRTNKLHESFRKLEKLDFSKLSYVNLANFYRDFAKIYYDWWTVTISLELVTITLEPLLGEKLKGYFKNKQSDFTRAFSILTSPLVLTFYRKQQKDLLNVLTSPRGKQEQALKLHQKNFYWIYNSYLEGKVLDLNFFKSELEKLKETNYKKTLKEIEEYPVFIKSEKAKIYEKIHPSKDFLNLVSLVETFSALQDGRKMDNFIADHYLEKFVLSFSKLFSADIYSLKLLILNELYDKKIIQNKSLIKNRLTSFVLDATDKEIIHYDGQNALLLANKFMEISNINQNIIQGTVASVGESHYFRGPAKIILTIDKIDKIREGDILVTTMTSPDFVIGMKKAGAIITDTGGMLSHAAIVSRELKKPCIVGTEIATKVISDGDIIELHCEKGTIKIVKHFN